MHCPHVHSSVQCYLALPSLLLSVSTYHPSSLHPLPSVSFSSYVFFLFLENGKHSSGSRYGPMQGGKEGEKGGEGGGHRAGVREERAVSLTVWSTWR